MINLGFYSGKECPDVRFHPTLVDRLLEMAALLVVLATWGGIGWLYTHEGNSLSPDVWTMGGVSLLCAVLLGIAGYAPIRFINFPVRINGRNAAIQYLLAIRLVRVMNVLLCLNFLFAVFMEHSALAALCLKIALALLALAFIAYYVLAFKCK